MKNLRGGVVDDANLAILVKKTYIRVNILNLQAYFGALLAYYCVRVLYFRQ